MRSDERTIPVWPGQVPDADFWRDAGPETDFRSASGTRHRRNVSQPTLTAYLPEPSVATGTGIIVCPGGAFHFLAIDKEGSDIARWLAERGVAAFVLKYRVVSTADEATAIQIAVNPTPHRPKMDRVRPAVIADGLQAIRVLREQADQWAISADRLGIVGFSAGAYAAVGAAMKFEDAASRPSFAASMYGEWWERWVPADAPPLFLMAASNDPLIDVRATSSLYDAWVSAGRQAELHLYGQGGHGFGVKRQGLPSDGWIDRFWEWLRAEGFVPDRAAAPE